ncbi:MULTISPECIES: SMR family transporter [unclassified Bacillus (in: firmicutes)]|uniref:DMT family transporter n=1 Tax=unclassified Bacillus (in: firmicutes) TaxID=185979 RepID=UPI0009766F66|nr:SMR family transporter [Bacillus sp. I-2]OMP29603.1 ligand-binding protein SH3 [Bacillus sp. I-2]
MKKSWMYVALTCLFELLWVFGLNRADAVWEWAVIICLIPVDFYFLMKACEKLPTGTVYAVFAGVGTIGTSLMDYTLFGGSFSLEKLLFMGILILGIIGLKVSDGDVHEQKGEAV